MLALCFLEFSVGIRTFVRGLSQISSFSLVDGPCKYQNLPINVKELSLGFPQCMKTRIYIWHRNELFWRSTSTTMLAKDNFMKVITFLVRNNYHLLFCQSGPKCKLTFYHKTVMLKVKGNGRVAIKIAHSGQIVLSMWLTRKSIEVIFEM